MIGSMKIQPFAEDQWLKIRLNPTGSIEVKRVGRTIVVGCEDHDNIMLDFNTSSLYQPIKTYGQTIHIYLSTRDCLSIACETLPVYNLSSG
jgi:hypothetical protein